MICILLPEIWKSPGEVLYTVLLKGAKKSDPLFVLLRPPDP